MMGRQDHDTHESPAASPDPASNSGYAEQKPCTKEQAQVPGAKQPPDSEEGGLDHDPDPKI